MRRYSTCHSGAIITEAQGPAAWDHGSGGTGAHELCRNADRAYLDGLQQSANQRDTGRHRDRDATSWLAINLDADDVQDSQKLCDDVGRQGNGHDLIAQDGDRYFARE